MEDHIDSPEPHRGPFAGLSDEDLAAAYGRVAAYPDDMPAPLLLAELEHRGIASSG